MKSPSPPPPPDPKATAEAQSGMNRDTATASQLNNMVDQFTPDGSLTYRQTGSNSYTDSTGKLVSIPKFRATQKLSPAQQGLYNLNNQTETNIATIGRDQSARIGELLGKPLNFDGAPEIYNPNFEKLGTKDFSADRQKVEDALMTRMQPHLTRDRAALETSLINKGVRAGSTAYDDAIRNADMQTNDARMSAILGAGDEQSRMFGMDMSRVGFDNNIEQQLYGNSVGNRQQNIQETLTQRNAPINEISALMSGSQVSQPNFVNTPQTQVAGTDYAGMVKDNYAAQMEAHKQKVSSNNAMMGGLFGMAGSAALMFSDRRLKERVKVVGKLENGLKVYSYRYKTGGPQQIGLMAQDVERKNPNAVSTHTSGFKMVDYSQAVEG